MWKTVLLRTLIALVFILAVAAVIGYWNWIWNWINNNSTPLTAVGTCVTGFALVVFAWLTYNLSVRLVETQYLPLLNFYSLSHPKTEEFTTAYSQYEGNTWKIHLLNPGNIPVHCTDVEIYIGRHGLKKKWKAIRTYCDLLDESNNLIIAEDKDIVVKEHDHRALIVVLHKADIKDRVKDWFGKQTEFILKVKLRQLRKLGGQDKSRWLETKSKRFCLADKLAKESTGVVPTPQP